MEEPEIEKIIVDNGGRVDYTFLDESLRKAFDLVKFRAEASIRVFAQLPGIKKISFDVIDNYQFNAFATGKNYSYFIGINRGTIATLSMIFNRLLADQEIFPYIGNPNLEEKELPLLEDISANFEYTVRRTLHFWLMWYLG